MADIVERLRALDEAAFYELPATTHKAVTDAANELVRLRSELEQVKRDNAELHALIFEAFGGELDATQIFQERVQQAAEASLAKLKERALEDEPRGYWIEQKGCEPYFLKPTAYIPRPGGRLNRTVTPLYAARAFEKELKE